MSNIKQKYKKLKYLLTSIKKKLSTKKKEKISIDSSRWNLNGREITNIPLIKTSINENLDFSIQSLIPKCKMERAKNIINNTWG